MGGALGKSRRQRFHQYLPARTVLPEIRRQARRPRPVCRQSAPQRADDAVGVQRQQQRAATHCRGVPQFALHSEPAQGLGLRPAGQRLGRVSLHHRRAGPRHAAAPGLCAQSLAAQFPEAQHPGRSGRDRRLDRPRRQADVRGRRARAQRRRYLQSLRRLCADGAVLPGGLPVARRQTRRCLRVLCRRYQGRGTAPVLLERRQFGERAHPYGHVHRQHRAAPRRGRRTAGQGSSRDRLGGIHHAKQWRLDHVRQTPELTACDPPPDGMFPAALKEGTMAQAKLAPNLPDWMVEHANRYLASGGTDGHMYRRNEITAPALLLTTTGRKSGDKFIFPLFYGTDGNSYIIVASKGGAPAHPGWYRNILANPEVEVQVGTKKLTARARTATGGERAQLWEKALKFWPHYADYQKKTEREIPVVVLEPVR